MAYLPTSLRPCSSRADAVGIYPTWRLTTSSLVRAMHRHRRHRRQNAADTARSLHVTLHAHRQSVPVALFVVCLPARHIRTKLAVLRARSHYTCPRILGRPPLRLGEEAALAAPLTIVTHAQCRHTAQRVLDVRWNVVGHGVDLLPIETLQHAVEGAPSPKAAVGGD